MARIDCTMIFVEAPGLRPTAVDAPMPIKPTPIAAPSAARPTCKLPVIALSFRRFGLANCGRPVRPRVRASRMPLLRLLVVLTDQQREDGGQQHEDQRLHQTDQQLHEIERDRQQPAEARHHRRHRLEHVLAGEDVAVEPEAERDGPEQDRDDLQAPGGEEHDDHQQLQQRPSCRPSARTAP